MGRRGASEVSSLLPLNLREIKCVNMFELNRMPVDGLRTRVNYFCFKCRNVDEPYPCVTIQ